MLEQKIQKFIDQTERQRDRDEIWKQTLEDNLVRLVKQHKVDTIISKLRHKEKLKLWKQDL